MMMKGQKTDKTELLKKYKDLKPQGHFFDDDTMHFFSSKIHDVLRVQNTYFFITSEKTSFCTSERAFTVRKMDHEGEINTVGEFLEFETKYKAQKHLDTIIMDVLNKDRK